MGDQHAHHQLRINGEAARVAVDRIQAMAQVTQILEAVDLPEQMSGRNIVSSTLKTVIHSRFAT